MGLKDKLNIYTKKKECVTSEHKPFTLSEINGAKINTEYGEIWRVENRLLGNEKYFNLKIKDILCDIKDLLEFNQLPLDFTPENLLFFDLETTSLNIGTGNYPFLAGLGYIDGDDFVTEQLFMESYADEAAILHYLLPFFEKAKGVVSFNGRAFDIPLIKNRYMLNRIYGFPVNIPSLDLIVPARRIFRSVFENCALQTLEKNVIGFARQGDIPGYMIPEVYFTFQKEGDWSRIPTVIEHNRLDIISMYVLMFLMANIFTQVKNKKYSKLNRQSLFNLGSHLFRTNINSFLDLMAYLEEDILDNETIFQKYSITLKREKEWQQAIKYWEKSGSLFSLQELAKYYEHKLKDYKEALACCEAASRLLKKKIYSPQGEKLAQNKFDFYERAFITRKKRMEKKYEKNKNDDIKK